MSPKANLKAIYFFSMLGILLLACRFGGLFDVPVTSTPAPTLTAAPTFTPLPTQTSTPAPTRTPAPTADRRVANPQNQHLYLYVPINKTWDKAVMHCKTLGAHLVTIESASENDFVYNLSWGNTWLGASDKAREGIWVWVTEQPFDFSHWDAGEPNNYEIEMYLTFSGHEKTWNDVAGGTMPFVCEWE